MTEYLHQLKEVEFTDFWLQAKSELFLKHLPKIADKRVLDLGAGTGLLTYRLAERGWQVDALEPDAEAVEWIKEKTAKYGDRVRVIHQSIESFKPEHPYSLVVMADVLEHIENDQAALEKIHQLLAPDGVLMMTVPAHPRLWNSHDVHCKHCRRYRKGELREKLSRHFTVKQLRYWNLAMMPLALANKIFVRKDYPHKAVNSIPWLNKFLKAYYVAVENNLPLPAGISLFAVALKAPKPSKRF